MCVNAPFAAFIAERVKWSTEQVGKPARRFWVASASWDLQRARQERALLTAPSLTGFYTHLGKSSLHSIVN